MAGADLTRTATSGASPAVPCDAPPQIGRYRIERIVGVGGMGVVYAGYDPDLERRVAVKVLRGEAAGVEQRARLLREARAMAKLAHRHVITVHEVGTDGDVDFIAMELIDGDNLAGWLRASRRPRAQILRAYRDAGRALAAAHAAGLVHRDFKPHNVLVARDGRVVVTDFGLARALHEPDAPVHVASAVAVAVPQTLDPARSGATEGGVPTTWTAGLTRTGSLLGTPTYMPPEQFVGAAGARADQFSFCVSLWEGLTGSRPFSGATLDELHQAVRGGVPAATGRELPRGLRRVLVRGLDPDASLRWPSMDALLAALARAEARPRWPVMALGATIAVALAIGLVGRSAPDAAATCGIDAATIDAAWSPARREGLPADVAAVAAPTFDGARRAWLAARESVCAAPASPVQAARAACLHDAGDRLAALVAATAAAPAARVRAADLAGMAPEPEVCVAAAPPAAPAAADRAALARGRAAIAGFLLAARAGELADTDARIAALVEDARATGECAALAEAELAAASALEAATDDRASVTAHADRAAVEAGRCGHDLAEADAAVWSAQEARASGQSSARTTGLRDRARAAVERAGRPPSLVARLELEDVELAVQGGRLDEALALLAAAHERLSRAQRVVDAQEALAREVYVRMLRSAPGDVAIAERRARETLSVLRAQLGSEHDLVAAAYARLANVVWHSGDRQAFAALRTEARALPARTRATAGPKLQRYHGRVVDVDGRPVEGVIVALSPFLIADSDWLGVFDFGGGGSAFDVWDTTTDAMGRFAVEAPERSMIAAELGGRRSRPVLGAAGQTLRLAPTGRVAGTVRFEAPRRGVMSVAAKHLVSPLGPLYLQVARIAADGAFALDHLPPGRYEITVQTADAQAGQITGRVVDVDAGETSEPIELRWYRGAASLELLLRASRGELDGAFVSVGRGTLTATSWAELAAKSTVDGDNHWVVVDRADADATRRGRELGGDLAARIEGLETGRYTVCVTPVTSAVLRSPTYSVLNEHATQVDVVCRPVDITGAASQQMTIEVAPMRRLPPQ